MTEVANLRKQYQNLFSGKQEPELVDVPRLPYLMIDGKGSPDPDGYAKAVSALYAVAYAVRAALKPVVAYSVPPLQGRWWAPDPEVFRSGDRAAWCWTMTIMQPAWATAGVAGAAMAGAARKRPVEGVRFELFEEGTCAQVLHTGPYSEEPATIARLTDFVSGSGRRITGRHHEIHLTRPRIDASDRMRTLIRYPV